MKVMTFNIRYGTADDGPNSWPFRREAALEMLRDQDADLVGLQEVLISQLHEIEDAMPDYAWVGIGREDGIEDGEFSAILYNRKRVSCLESHSFWFSDTPEVVASSTWGNICTRLCTYGRFQVGGREFWHFNIHIDHESAYSRLRSIELLLDRIRKVEPLPVIVTGDFNCSESSEPIERMGQSGFLDAYRQTHPDEPEQATYHAWTDVQLGERIDYIFISQGWQVSEAHIHRANQPTYVSDHYPLLAQITA